jgi:hypothetical protein
MAQPWEPLLCGGTPDLYDAAMAWLAAHEIVRDDGRWPLLRRYDGRRARREVVLAGVREGLVVDHRRDGLAQWLPGDDVRALVEHAWRRVRDPRARVASLPHRLYLFLTAFERDGDVLLFVEIHC